MNATFSEKVYDVVICGGGLAGQTLARQLKQSMPELDVIVLDRMRRPLPTTTYKVGESTVEAGGHYLGKMLQLDDYFEQKHVFKMGLRYFFGDAAGPFEDRPEYGLSQFPTVDSYQIDRGVLENDLRNFNEADGVDLVEGVRIKSVILNDDRHPHEVHLHGHDQSIRAKWVVDATGRRRLLQKKLGLGVKRRKNCSAAWFRVQGRVDVNDLVSRTNIAWHNRVPDDQRYYSTNHLMGDGYWIWIIPLPNNHSSIGIVALEDKHTFTDFHKFEKAMNWLEAFEPTLAEHLADFPPLDFGCIRNYSYSSKQVFSEQRWSCVGEAAVFVDPFYSPGIDMIGYGNSITTEMIRRDLADELTADSVKQYNQFFLGIDRSLADTIQSGYPFHGQGVAMTAKLLWDATAAWSFIAPRMFNTYFLDHEKSKQIRAATSSFFGLTRRMRKLFADWSKLSDKSQLAFEFFDYLSIDYLYSLRQRNLQSGKTMPELLADQAENMQRFEELAQVLLLLAVEDVMPERLPELQNAGWLNAWAVSLNPDRWETDGLFRPKSTPRDRTQMQQDIRSMFHAKSKRELAGMVA